MQRTELLALFRTMASEITEKDFSGVQEDSVIAEMGMDSLAMLELVGTMERELKVQVPDDKLVGLQTVSQLLDVIAQRISPA